MKAAVLALTVALLAACSMPRSGLHVVYIPKTTDPTNSFWAALEDGVRLSAQDHGVAVTVRGPSDETGVDEQIALVDAAIGEKPDALLLAASDWQRLVPAVQRARRAGIAVVTVDSSIATDDASARIGTDNEQLGRLAGAALAQIVERGTVVGVLSYIRESSTARDREAGLTSALVGGFTLLPTRYNGSDQATARRQAKQLLSLVPPPGALVALNLPSTLGAIEALRESGLQSQVALVGVDASFEVLKSVESGVLRAVLVQQPFNMGYLGVEAAVELASGRPWPRNTDTGAIPITKDTLFLPQNERVLFPVTVLNSPHPVSNR